MHIKHLTLMSGPAGSFPVGHEREVSEKEGKDLIAGGYAIEIKPRVVETATARPGETATTAEQEAAKHLASIKKATAGKKASRKSGGSGKGAEASADGLFGSDVQPAVLTAPSGLEVTLGDIVRAAFEASGMTAAEWNEQTAEDREAAIALSVEGFFNANPAEQ